MAINLNFSGWVPKYAWFKSKTLSLIPEKIIDQWVCWVLKFSWQGQIILFMLHRECVSMIVRMIALTILLARLIWRGSIDWSIKRHCPDCSETLLAMLRPSLGFQVLLSYLCWVETMSWDHATLYQFHSKCGIVSWLVIWHFEREPGSKIL
jgi:hypothetical protein